MRGNRMNLGLLIVAVVLGAVIVVINARSIYKQYRLSNPEYEMEIVEVGKWTAALSVIFAILLGLATAL